MAADCWGESTPSMVPQQVTTYQDVTETQEKVYFATLICTSIATASITDSTVPRTIGVENRRRSPSPDLAASERRRYFDVTCPLVD